MRQHTTSEVHDSSLPLAVARGMVLATALVLLCRDVAGPFSGWHELNSAMYSQFARNHIQYGLAYTKLYCTWGDTLAPPPTPQRYLNHPPLIAVWTAVPLALLGDREWAARMVPIAATLGSTALLMTILSRLGGPLLGTLTGLCFATLPLTAYFGRMIDHVAPVQFLSLLMVHGYLAWTGAYGGSLGRRAGAAWYALGAVLGIGTGWAALLAAGLLWAWHGLRVARRAGEARLLLWLGVVPALALGAVVLHIAAGCGWDLEVLGQLVARRSLGGAGGRQPWSAWLAVQGQYFVRNFTLPGAVAVILCLPLLVDGLVRVICGQAGRRFPLAGEVAFVVAFSGLQGTLYVVLLKNQSWFHDYWQFFLAPCVAASMAGLVLATHDVLVPRAPRLARVAVLLLLLAPMPWSAASMNFYATSVLVDRGYVEALVRLRGLLPHRAPAWTSRRERVSSETLGGHTSRWPNPVIAYYADRPLLYSRDVQEIEANAPGCAAYLLQRSRKPWARDLERALSRAFESVPAGDEHVIFLLDRPLRPQPPP